MTQTPLIATLERLQPVLERVGDPELQSLMTELFNQLEVVIAEHAALRHAAQQLRDEVNHLKGEQGKPEFKPTKKPSGNVSSESERRHAERDAEADASNIGFKLDTPSVAKLKEHRIPDAVLDALVDLHGTRYADETAFIQAVESAVGPELTAQYRALLVEHTRYRKRNRPPKIPKVTIDREEICPVDTTALPSDAVWKGYNTKVVQDVLIHTDNVKFHRETYYSPSRQTTYLGALPLGYHGEFGPHINTQILSMKYVNGMSIPNIQAFYETQNVLISRTYISDRLTKHLDVFHQEKSAMYHASLEQGRYQHIDDTTSRVDGQTYYTHIVCSPCATLFFSRPRKDRLTILDVLQDGDGRHFLFNEEAFRLLNQLKVPQKHITRLHELDPDYHLTESEMESVLHVLFPDPAKGPLHQTRIREAGAIASYHQQLDHPIVEVLVCDDAPQFKLLTEALALCWVHDGRHYKRLHPVVPEHRTELETFLQRYWAYYRSLYLYKQAPSDEAAQVLSDEFETLFATTTGYSALDDRIAKSRAKKAELLAVLTCPDVPLHTNPAEHGAREQKRREDVSLQTKTQEGTAAKDTMMSIIATCKKLGVNAYHFLYDRISQTFAMPSLAEMIRAKSDP